MSDVDDISNSFSLVVNMKINCMAHIYNWQNERFDETGCRKKSEKKHSLKVKM